MIVSICGWCNFPADSVTGDGFTIGNSYSAIAKLAGGLADCHAGCDTVTLTGKGRGRPREMELNSAGSWLLLCCASNFFQFNF